MPDIKIVSSEIEVTLKVIGGKSANFFIKQQRALGEVTTCSTGV